jgi:hypothetical protein
LTTVQSGFDLDGVTLAVVDYQRANVPAEAARIPVAPA